MVYLIAEVGSNHNGSFELAEKMLRAAASTGVNAVKFQTFIAEELISKNAPKAKYQILTTGDEDTQLEMTKKLELNRSDYLKLVEIGKEIGVDVFSTPFDMDSLEFLIQSGMTTFKIPSGEITNLPYLERIGKVGGHVILSTGMATIPEIQAALDVLKNNGTDDVTILHATTEYPTRTADINLNAMKTLQHHFDGYQIGLSDHSLGYAVAIGAAALGATTIEKHFTIDNTLPGPDQKASATPDVLSALVSGVRTIEEAMGSADKKAVEVEIFNKIVARKSIVARRDIKRGEVFTEENITVKRPGNGISPMRWYDVLGKEAQRDFKYDDLIVDERFEWQE
ncbi:N-acetylneuraminate synthase [Weissella confusa]|uniref:N-acetylneuraminate synthase n=1 Tax=Weissella confusa TaxID=1583 RepID=UPI00107F8D21|nr:N-acetylneuraminate synthase [Weissella confusa]MBJ7658594.1 N-acetylneuraminate synthase [Weissella confusa]TGE64184.1 N-acetylneuraminate synthase [Weissella confusa]